MSLGSNARQTGRGSNAGKYIREGSDGPAILRVTLLNEGSDAYKPGQYGRKIIIERRIAKNSSSYHILNADGKVLYSLFLYIIYLTN